MTTPLGTLRDWVVGPEVLLLAINVALASGLICGLGLLAVWAARGRAAPLRHGLLVAAFVLTLASPLLFGLADALGWGVTIPVTGATEGERSARPALFGHFVQTDLGSGPAMSGALPGKGAHAANTPQAEALPLAIQAVGTLLVVIWAVGTVLMVAGLVRGLVTLAHLRATFLAVRDPALCQAATASFRVLGIRQRVELDHTPLALTPFSLGLLRPRIVLPAGLTDCLDAEQLRYVLLHEAAHIRRRDHWVALLQYGCTAAFWWNPLLHAANARLVCLREQICDDHVLSAGGDGRVFAEALVRVAEWGAVQPDLLCSAALLNHRTEDRDGDAAGCRELEERIVRLVRRCRPRELRMSATSRLTVAAFGLLLAAGLPIAGLRAAGPDDPSGYGVPAPSAALAVHATGPVQPELPAPPDQPGLGQRWLMYLPAGFVHRVTLTPCGPDRYRLDPPWLNSSGVYAVRGDRLVIVEPDDRRLFGFQWQIDRDGRLTLVDQPPLRETGSDYLGAMMVPATD